MAFWSEDKRKSELTRYLCEALWIVEFIEKLGGATTKLQLVKVDLLWIVSSIPSISKSVSPARPNLELYTKPDIVLQNTGTPADNLLVMSHVLHSLIWYLLAIRALSPEFVATENSKELIEAIDGDILRIRELLSELWEKLSLEVVTP